MISNNERFRLALEKDPGLIDRMEKRAQQKAFEKEYGVCRATPLKCPSCASYLQSPGSLWHNPEIPEYLTCRKCKLQFQLTCLTLPTQQVIEELRQVVKGEGTLPSWLKKDDNPG